MRVMQLPGYSVSRGIKAGAIGGIAGSLVLGLLGELAAVSMGQEVFYVTIAKKLGFGDASVIGGWVLHFIVGMVAGAVFVGITAVVKSLALTTTRKSLWVGLLAGAAVWVVVYVPVTAFLVPADLTSAMFAVGSLVLHMVFGIVTALAAVSLLRRGLKTAAPAKTSTS